MKDGVGLEVVRGEKVTCAVGSVRVELAATAQKSECLPTEASQLARSPAEL